MLIGTYCLHLQGNLGSDFPITAVASFAFSVGYSKFPLDYS
jgi:hypothetical protein